MRAGPIRGAITFASVLAVGIGTAAAHASSAGPSVEDRHEVRLTGCVVRGEGDGAGYLLTNTPAEPAWQHSDARVAPSAIGTTGGYATIFYWLDDDDDLDQHVGHRVEVEGELKGDLKEGEIVLDRKDDWTEMTVKSDGRTMKARVPHTSIVGRDRNGQPQRSHVLVRKVDVEKVTMLAAACQP
jgi:hypothetical protein